MAGLSLVRGAPLPVVNGATLIGETAGPPSRFITLQVGSRLVVLATQDMVGIRAMDADLLHGLPPLLAGAQDDAVTTVGALDSELLWLLDAAKIVPSDLTTVGALDEVTA